MKLTESLFGLASAALLALPAAAQAQGSHAHVHGQLTLDVVIEGATVVVEMRSPLENFTGFERSPRTDAEKKAAEKVLAQLRAADQMFKIDPAANCSLGPVELRSAALGLGKAEAAAGAGHADLDGTFSFNCGNAQAVTFIYLALFSSFKGLRQIDAQIAAPQGQFKRTLRRPNARLAWRK